MTEAAGHGEQVGSLSEEAARLLGSLAGWAREQGTDLGRGVEELAEQVGGSLHGLDEHLATGAPECTVCPVCRAVAALRGVSPEVRDHLTAAAGSLLQAAGALLDTRAARPARPDPPGAPRAAAPVQRIDLDDESAEQP